jgi:uncharacterized protein YbjT (DUF2867 family)
MESEDYMTRKVLVTGATGTVGRQLVLRLAAKDGIAVRALVHHREKGRALEGAGAEVAVGAFDDTGVVRAAVEGIDTLVLITPSSRDAVAQARAVLAAAWEAGVRKIVRQSVIKAALNGPTENVRLHAETEKDILTSGLAYTILRPHYFMQNILRSVPSLAAENKIYGAMGDGKLGMIDARDIAECAEQSVLSDRFDGQILTLTGPERLNFYDVAGVLSEILGRPVAYVPISLEALEQSLRDRGMGDWVAPVTRDYAKAYKEGWGDFVTDDLERITGHPARPFDAFAREVLAPALQSAGL